MSTLNSISSKLSQDDQTPRLSHSDQLVPYYISPDSLNLLKLSNGKYTLSQGFPFSARVETGQLIWESDQIVTSDHVKQIVNKALSFNQSVHINTGTHGGSDGGTVVTNPNLGSALFIEQDFQTALSTNNVSINILSSQVPPIYPKGANHIINAWCHSCSSNFALKKAATKHSVEELSALILSLLDEQAIQNDLNIHSILSKKLDEILNLESRKALSSANEKFYNLAKYLLDSDKRIRTIIANKLIRFTTANTVWDASIGQKSFSSNHSSGNTKKSYNTQKSYQLHAPSDGSQQTYNTVQGFHNPQQSYQPNNTSNMTSPYLGQFSIWSNPSVTQGYGSQSYSNSNPQTYTYQPSYLPTQGYGSQSYSNSNPQTYTCQPSYLPSQENYKPKESVFSKIGQTYNKIYGAVFHIDKSKKVHKNGNFQGSYNAQKGYAYSYPFYGSLKGNSSML